MNSEQHELYENARKRLRQKRFLYYHFVFFCLANLFSYVANTFFEIGSPTKWWTWVFVIWLFILILHFIDIYITKRFLNKNWERQQIERLVRKQEQRIDQLKNKLESDSNK
jgi:amino acid permease